MALAIIAGMIKSGKIKVSSKNVDALEITAANQKIDVNAIDKAIFKETLAATRRGKGKGTLSQLKTIQSSLGMARDAAEELAAAGITITLSYKGDAVVTMGSQANPKLSSLATGTKAIEINRPLKLIELAV
ncbi:MAG: hypothetical protein NWE98_05550 [Candidatus Bathyarchaeota archaeon]|nr:hypothetical protein [Candidatus Bathyarchaeota archaeon]